VWFVRGADHVVGRIDPTSDAVGLWTYASSSVLLAHPGCEAAVLGPQQHIWFAEEDDGFSDMVDFDPVAHTSSVYATGAELSHGLAFGADGGLWFGEGGNYVLKRFDPVTHTITPIAFPGSSDPNAFVIVTDVVADPNGSIWMTMNGLHEPDVMGSADVARYDIASGTFTLGRLRRPKGTQDPADDLVSIARTPSGTYWFADSFASILPDGALGRAAGS
jgi:streptogramin lyase